MRTYDQQQSTRRQQHLTDIYANKIMRQRPKITGIIYKPSRPVQTSHTRAVQQLSLRDTAKRVIASSLELADNGSMMGHYL